jgi:preprotein translocase subunit YajC
MTLILLESLLALVILVSIVWWTMRPAKKDAKKDDSDHGK